MLEARTLVFRAPNDEQWLAGREEGWKIVLSSAVVNTGCQDAEGCYLLLTPKPALTDETELLDKVVASPLTAVLVDALGRSDKAQLISDGDPQRRDLGYCHRRHEPASITPRPVCNLEPESFPVRADMV